MKPEPMMTSTFVVEMVRNLKIPDTAAKFVLMELATFYNRRSKNAWPSVARLAEDTSLSTRTVQRKLRDLEAAGLIALDEESTPKSPRKYRFCFLEEGCQADTPKGGDGCQPRQAGVSTTTGRDDTGDTLTIEGTVQENSTPVVPRGDEEENSLFREELDQLRERLCRVFGKTALLLKDVKVKRSWPKAVKSGGMTSAAVTAVERWYALRDYPACQPKGYWTRSALPTLLNNWVHDVAHIQAQLPGAGGEIESIDSGEPDLEEEKNFRPLEPVGESRKLS